MRCTVPRSLTEKVVVVLGCRQSNAITIKQKGMFFFHVCFVLFSGGGVDSTPIRPRIRLKGDPVC